MQHEHINTPLSANLPDRFRSFSRQFVQSAIATPVGKSTWIMVAIAVAVLLAVFIFIAHVWAAIGVVTISRAGWVAIVFGVIVTLILGTGLMALVFISSREGLDEAAGVMRVSVEEVPQSLTNTPNTDSEIKAR